jgi:hypothetical protein
VAGWGRGLATELIQKGISAVQKLDPDQLQFVEILAKLMSENEVFKEEYTPEDFEDVVDWLKKLRSQVDITIDTLQEQIKAGS